MSYEKFPNIDSRHSPLSPDYPSCAEVEMTLHIFVDDDPEIVTDYLNLLPTKISRKGDVRRRKGSPSPNRKGSVCRVNRWEISSSREVSSMDLRDHLDWLIEKLKPCEEALWRLQNVPGITMTVSCLWASRGSGGPVIWPEQMIGLARLNLEVALLFLGSDEE